MNCCASGTGPCHLSVTDCFERGLKTRRLKPFSTVGPRISSNDGLWASFSLEASEGRVTALAFECVSCTTLIACCQALVDLGGDGTVRAALHFTQATLLDRLAGIPVYKRDRATLAVDALRAALRVMDRERSVEGAA